MDRWGRTARLGGDHLSLSLLSFLVIAPPTSPAFFWVNSLPLPGCPREPLIAPLALSALPLVSQDANCGGDWLRAIDGWSC